MNCDTLYAAITVFLSLFNVTVEDDYIKLSKKNLGVDVQRFVMRLDFPSKITAFAEMLCQHTKQCHISTSHR